MCKALAIVAPGEIDRREGAWGEVTERTWNCGELRNNCDKSRKHILSKG